MIQIYATFSAVCAHGMRAQLMLIMSRVVT